MTFFNSLVCRPLALSLTGTRVSLGYSLGHQSCPPVKGFFLKTKQGNNPLKLRLHSSLGQPRHDRKETWKTDKGRKRSHQFQHPETTPPPPSGARPSGLSLRSRISVWLDCRLGVILLNVQFSCFGFPLSVLDYAFPVLLQTLGKRRFSSRTVPHGVAVPRFI